MKRLLALALVLLLGSARAELWGYVDGAGVAHLATFAVDERFSLVAGTSDKRVAGKTDGSQALLTWLEFASESKALQPLLRAAAARHGLDAELLTALITVESGFDARAVSKQGAVGLMQITPIAARQYAVPALPAARLTQRLLEPATNIDTGARMLADLLRRFGRVDRALAAWNAGAETVHRNGGELPPIDETRAHVQLVLELYWALLQRSLPAQAREFRIHASSP